MYWFGEVRVRTQAQDLGVDHSVFGFSNQDYVRRSVSSMYVPLGAMLLAVAAGLLAHWSISRWAGPPATDPARTEPPPDGLRWVIIAMAGAGIATFAIGLSASVQTNEPIWGPVCLGLGVVLVSYAAFAWRRWLAAPARRPAGAQDLAWVTPLFTSLVALLVIIATFWAVTLYAEAVASGLTDQLVANDLSSRPNVVVYSERQLFLEGDGVQETRLAEADGGYRFRYDGLKLLLFSKDKYFLLPATWTPPTRVSPGTGTLVVLPDNDSVRLEFFR